MSPPSSTHKYSLDKESVHSDTPIVRYIDPSPPRQTRGSRLLSKLTGRGRPSSSTGPAQRRTSPEPFVVGGARIDPKTQPKSTGPFIVGGRRVEPATQPRKPTGPAFVVGGARIEPSSRPQSGPFIVGGPRVERR